MKRMKRIADLCVNIGYLLDRTSFAALTMLRSDHATIGTLPELLDKDVFGVNDESGIDGGERVTLHVGCGERWGR